MHSALQDVNEALNRLPPAEVDARNQRLRRAHDISLKKEYLAQAAAGPADALPVLPEGARHCLARPVTHDASLRPTPSNFLSP